MRKHFLLSAGIVMIFFLTLEPTTSAQWEAGVDVLASSTPCGFSVPEQPIPDDGSWLLVCLLDPTAPEATTVATVRLKYLIDHPDPGQLEVYLGREKDGFRQPLWEQGKATGGSEFGKTSQLTTFEGSPSQGPWYLWIRDAMPGQQGMLKVVSLVADYRPLFPLPQPLSDPTAHPGALRLPEGILPSTTPDREEGKPLEPGSDTGQSTATLQNSGWQEIKRETFEGVFPNPGWTRMDANPNDGKEYLWDDDNYRAHPDPNDPYPWAAWPARGGTNGYDPASNPHYPPNMASWMIYGPFDASDARIVEVSFWLWRQVEAGYDKVWFVFSNDGVNFSGWWWDGNADWEEKRFDLTAYLAGDASVWVGWLFESDSTIQYEGPWVDDILIRKYVAGEVTVEGSFSFADRNNNPVPARFTRVYLYDRDPGGSDDLLDTTVTDASGFFQFPARPNWDEDDPDPDPSNRRLDLYVVWETDVNDSASARRRVNNFGGQAYRWQREPQTNVQDGIRDFSRHIGPGDNQLPAMWIFQELRKAWEYVRNTTGVDPGSVTAKWEKDQNCYPSWPFCGSYFNGGIGGPYIFIAHNSVISGDTVVHETGHHYMWNATGWWLWWDVGCYNHNLFSQEDVNCAWSEGWADFLPLVVNGDECYDFGIGPCTGIPDHDHYNLEAHSRSDDSQVFPWGDTVEGRVAGALYDLFDNANENFDTATFGFVPIINIVFQAPHEDRFSAFWGSWKTSGQNKHHAVRAIWQNTMNYDASPRFEPPLPDHTVLQGLGWENAIDLWAYSTDEESNDWELDWQVVYTSDGRCGVTIDAWNFVDIHPQAGWLGSCDVTIRVSDSLKTAEDTFRVNVVPVQAQVFLPLILKNSP